MVDELKYPKDLESNQFIKRLWEEFVKIGKEVRELKDTKNHLEIKVAGLKTILEKDAGIKVIEYENGVKFEYSKPAQEREREERQRAELEKQPKKIMGHHEYIKLDGDNNILCNVCDCHLTNKDKQVPQKVISFFCSMECVLLSHAAYDNAINELKKSGKLNH